MRYLARKPVEPKTVTVRPESEDRPPVGGPYLIAGRTEAEGLGGEVIERSLTLRFETREAALGAAFALSAGATWNVSWEIRGSGRNVPTRRIDMAGGGECRCRDEC